MEWFAPWLIPLRHRSGLRRRTLSTASLTQSAGAPEHCQASTPSNRWCIGWRRRGLPIVIAWPMPDWGLSGATTTTFPNPFTASTRLRIPGALIPSSLVIRITGSFFRPPVPPLPALLVAFAAGRGLVALPSIPAMPFLCVARLMPVAPGLPLLPVLLTGSVCRMIPAGGGLAGGGGLFFFYGIGFD